MKLFIRLLTLVLISIALLILWRLYLYERNENYRTGVSLFKTGEYSDAKRLLEPYAINGNVIARSLIGQIYALGLGVDQDPEQAVFWFNCDGLDNCEPGRHELNTAIEFFEGRLVTQSTKDGIYWANVSLDKGCRKAITWHAKFEQASMNQKGQTSKGQVH